MYMADIFLRTLELRSGRFDACRILCNSQLNTYSQLCNNVEGTAGKIETPTQWNPIGSRMTAPSSVLTPSSILRHPFFYCSLILATEILSGRLKRLFELSLVFQNCIP